MSNWRMQAVKQGRKKAQTKKGKKQIREQGAIWDMMKGNTQ